MGGSEILVILVIALLFLGPDKLPDAAKQISKGILQVNAGSLFPAFRRLERDGLIKADWRVTENNRRAKYYALTADGRAKLKRETRDWEQQAAAIARVLKASLTEL